MMIRELQPTEFTERLEPIFRYCEQEAGRTDGNSSHLFPQWRNWMKLGIARAWENDGCIIGMLIHPHIFSGRLRAHISFWFALPEARGTGRPIELLAVAEQAAKEAGCEKISSSAFGKLAPERTAHIYEKRGYGQSEVIFTKELI